MHATKWRWTRVSSAAFAVGVFTMSLPVDVATRPAMAPSNGIDAPPAVAVDAVRSVGFTVSDMSRALDFYTRVLPFETVADIEVSGADFERLHGVFGARARVVRLRLGREELELTEYLAPRGRPYPADTRGNDRWFQHAAIVVSSMARAYQHLRAHGVAHASTGPQRLPDWNPGAAGIEAFYFRDPDGHFLEVIAFPPGKGDNRWHQPTDALFRGIDHTAITVGDTERSLAFYRDALGLGVAGSGENHGVEQEHLNNVFGVRLRITTLRAASGPGIELLEYRAPRTGRPAPTDLQANDLAHWQTTVTAPDPSPPLTATRLFDLVSPDVQRVTALTGLGPALLVRDPDGHGVRVAAPSR